MSTQATLAAPNPIQQGVALYDKRILPAKLDNSARHNGLFFGRYIHGKGLNANILSPEQISDLLYQATVEDCEKEKPELKWAVAPKALTKRAEQHKAPTTRPDARTVSNFEERVRASEKVDEQRRAQEAAKKRATELVDRFAPVNHRRGVMNYDLRDTKQKEWRKKIAEAKDFVKLEAEIAKEQRAIYEKLEKQAERV
jgi:hypothetical protein